MLKICELRETLDLRRPYTVIVVGKETRPLTHEEFTAFIRRFGSRSALRRVTLEQIRPNLKCFDLGTLEIDVTVGDVGIVEEILGGTVAGTLREKLKTRGWKEPREYGLLEQPQPCHPRPKKQRQSQPTPSSHQ